MDNLLLASFPITMAVAFLPGSLIFAPFFFLLTMIVTAIFTSVRMHRAGARTLQEEETSALVSIIKQERRAYGLPDNWNSSFKVYCAPTAREATAFVMGGFRPKLIVTGRLAVAAHESPQKVAVILRHELAHICNGDTWVWHLFVPTWVLAIPVLAISVAISVLSNDSGQAAATGPIQAIVMILGNAALIAYFFRRREYLADAIAMNRTEDRDLYISALNKRTRGPERGWFHPSAEDRVAALQIDSPVLRANLGALLAILYVGLANLSFFVTNTQSELRSGDSSPLSIFFGVAVLVFVLLAALWMELGKGWSRKIPLTAIERAPRKGESTSTPPARPAPLRGNLSRLAEFAGVGGEAVRWGQVITLLLAAALSPIIERLCTKLWLRTQAGSSAYPLLGSLTWIGILEEVLAWALLALALRFRRSVIEAGMIVSAYWGIVSFLNGVWLSHLHRPWLDLVLAKESLSEFFWCCLGFTALAWASRKFRNAWVMLWVGMTGLIAAEYVPGFPDDWLALASAPVQAAVFSSLICIAYRVFCPTKALAQSSQIEVSQST